MRADAGDFSGADKSLTQARLLAAKNEEHWSDALLIWTEATILALRGRGERAEVAFLKAIETAEQQGAKSPQLRAVTGLTRLLIAQG